MDKTSRSQIQNATQMARRLLEKEYKEQLEGIFDILPNGNIKPQPGSHLSEQQQITRKKLVAAIEHEKAGGCSPFAAVSGYFREAAFTTLNRFVALKMLEARNLVQDCVSKGEESAGFREFGLLAPALANLPDHGYRLYIECLFDEIAVKVKILFDRRSSASLLWPRRQALQDFLEILNREELKPVWPEDETIGWFYQYFNGDDERKKMREDSAAPRNSRELAVRNQFFTPRYVVEFLTDNTLGRSWFEMRKGQTRVVEKCRYFVRRPQEIYLDRPLKDPREIRVLDPACGSGHFLLYAFELLEAIYLEAWENSSNRDPSNPEQPSLAAAYPTAGDFRKTLPELILRHNLHGVDIDPRAAQIAALALWMRAQRSFNEAGIPRSQRPPIVKTNIVTAEPMPGEIDLLKDFAQSLEHPLYGQLLEKIFEKMKLAGEAGSLLRIEDELRENIAQAKAQWVSLKTPKPKQHVFTAFEPEKPEQLDLFDVTGISEESFWERLETHIHQELERFSKSINDLESFQRRLFAEDTDRSFGFIDVCRKKYDVVLMNPPFGDSSLPAKPYIEETYGDTKGDVYKAFVECFQDRLVPGGFLGIISSRTGFFLAQSADWRERVVLRLYRPLFLADFGHGVLDAMVETAAYVLRSLTSDEDKQLTLSLLPDLLEVQSDKSGFFSIPKYAAQRGGLKRHQAVQELRRLQIEGYVKEIFGNFPRFELTKTAYSVISSEAKQSQESSYPEMTCFRLLHEPNKAQTLMGQVLGKLQKGLFLAQVPTFKSLPECCFSYWISGFIQKIL